MYDPVLLRHRLHQIPELAFEEYATKALIKSSITQLLAADGERSHSFKLREFDLSCALLLEYHGAKQDMPYQLFRADMDALPLSEDSSCSFASQHPDRMHACGHDVHMAVLLGLIQKVWQQQPRRNLLFLFQPAEEGKGGAQSVLSEGIIQSFNVDSAFALHVASNMPVGTISSKAGIFFGIPQEFDLHFYGKSAHVAFPELGVNALSCALDFMQGITKDVAELSKQERVIFHVGKMQAGQIRNVIADKCSLEGTHRTLSPAVRDRLNAMMEHHARQSAQRYGATAEVQLLGTYDAVVNDAQLLEDLKQACQTLGYTFEAAETVMTGEDFGFFTSLYPGLLFWLGSGNCYPLHSPKFLPNDACIEVGIELMYQIIQQ